MKKLLVALGLVTGTFLIAAPASAAVVISFTPSAQHVNIGDTVGIDVSISGLDAEILSAFDLNFQYDPSILGLPLLIDGSSAFAQLGGAYGTPPLFVFDSLTNGNLGIQASALDDDATVALNQANAFLLFHFELAAMTNGVTYFGLGLDPDFERNFAGLQFLPLSPDIGNACVGVGTGECPVPEPSSSALVALALAGLLAAGASRRRSGPGAPRH